MLHKKLLTCNCHQKKYRNFIAEVCLTLRTIERILEFHGLSLNLLTVSLLGKRMTEIFIK